MSMILKHNPNGGPCTWRTVEEACIEPPGAITPVEYIKYHKEMGDRAFTTCSAGHETRVSILHGITADGTLNPSYKCPVGDNEHFHVSGVVLEGWNGGSAEKGQPLP